MADGSIRIDTRLNNKEIAKDLNDFSNMAKRTAQHIKRAFAGKDNLDNLKQEIKDTEKIIKDSQREIDNYQKRLNNIDAEKPIKEIKKMVEENSKAIQKARVEVDKYQKRLKDLDSEKVVVVAQREINKVSSTIEKTQEKINKLTHKLEDLEAMRESIESKAIESVKMDGVSGTGFDDSPKNLKRRANKSLEGDKDYQKIIDQEIKLSDTLSIYNDTLMNAKQKQDELHQSLIKIKSELSENLSAKMNEYSQKTKEAENNAERLAKQMSDVKESTSKDILGGMEKSANTIEKASSKLDYLKNKFKSLREESSKTSKSTNQLGDVVNRVGNKGKRSIMKMAMAIFSVRGAYTLLRKASNEYLSSNEKLSGQIQGIWNAIGQAIGPVVEKIVSGVVTMVSYINAFIKVMTGIDLVAKGNAAALKKQASATKGMAKETEKANRQLASFDEMNVLQANKSSDSGGSSGTDVPQLQLDAVNVDGLKDKFLKLLDPLQNAWKKYGTDFVNSFQDGLKSIWEMINSIGKSFNEVWMNGTGERTCSLILQILTNCFDIIGDFAKGFDDAWKSTGVGTSIIQHLWNILNNILEGIKSITQFIDNLIKKIDFKPILEGLNSILSLFDDLSEIASFFIDDFLTSIINGDWSGAGESISTAFADIFDTVREWIANIDWFQLGYDIAKFISDGVLAIIEMIINMDWGKLIASIFLFICEAIVSAGKLVLGVIGGILSSIWENIQKAFTYENVLRWIQGVIQSIEDALESIGQWFSDKFYEALEIIQNIFSPIGEWFSQRYEDICAAFGLIGEWFEDKFNQAYTFICNIFSGIGQWFGDRWNDIANVFSNIGTWFNEKFNEAYKSVTSAFSNAGKFFAGIWDNIKSAFGNISEWFKNSFSKAWTAVKNVFSTGGKIFDGIKEGILNGLKAVVNAIITGINKVIKIPFDGINSALKKIKGVNILGYKPFDWIGTISVPQIPKLARGGIVNNPGAGVNMGSYIAGEKGAEAIVPLENSEFIQSFAKEIASILSEMGQPVNIILKIGDKEFYKWFINLKRKYEFVTNGG